MAPTTEISEKAAALAGRFDAEATAAVVTSYYWHFVDVVWIALWATIYLLK